MKRALPAMLAMLLVARTAAATVDGPELARVLGWDAAAHRVYVQLVHTGETESTPTLWWFDLGSARPAEPHVVEWSGGEGDALYERRLAAVVKRLRPLHAEECVESMLGFGLGSPVPHDSVDSDAGRRPRYRATVRPVPGRDETLGVLTIDPSRHAVRRLRQYALPGSPGKLLILSCDAIPTEGDYEIQFPVVWGAGPGTADPVDPAGFNVRH